MDYQQFYGVYGPESRQHNRFEGFGVPLSLMNRMERQGGALDFFQSLSPAVQNRLAGYVRGAGDPQEEQRRIQQVCAALAHRNVDETGIDL